MTNRSSDDQNYSVRDRALRRLAAWAALFVAIVLVALKLAAWIATGSVALLSSAIDALVDMASSVFTFIGVRYAERPPDHDHRFGHGKGEAVAGFTQAPVLTGAALVLAFQSAERLIFPEQIEQIGVGIAAILVSLPAAIGLVLLQTWVVRQTSSTATAADRAHYLTDIAVNLAVLSALGVTRATGWERADPAFALAIAGYMLWSSYKIAMDVLEQLLDRELPHDERERIKETYWLVRASKMSMTCGRVTPGTGPLSNSILRSRATLRSKKVTPSATRAKRPLSSYFRRPSKSRPIWNPLVLMTIGSTT
jgi:cation diffusion facilitator family transporter